MKNEVSARSGPVQVYFLGSGGLAVPVLEALLSDPGIEMAGVGTQPDRPRGRRQQRLATPVGQCAQAHGITPDKPESVNTSSWVEYLRALGPELVVVVSFGQILKREVLELPACGCLNVHASLLPRHRGASPVNAAILHGDRETGVSLMRMDEGLDTGPTYRVVRLALTGRETAPELEERLARLAAEHIGACIRDVCRGGLLPLPQPETGVTHARKLKKQDGAVDWRLPADQIERRIRALQPWPRVFFLAPVGGTVRRIQVLKACARAGSEAAPGTVLEADSRKGWSVACGRGVLDLLRVVPEGRHEMDATEFLRGCPIPSGTVLTETESGSSPQPA